MVRQGSQPEPQSHIGINERGDHTFFAQLLNIFCHAWASFGLAASLPGSAVNAALFSLEMKRLVKQLPGKLFVRNK